jgi:hypothetical protein
MNIFVEKASNLENMKQSLPIEVAIKPLEETLIMKNESQIIKSSSPHMSLSIFKLYLSLIFLYFLNMIVDLLDNELYKIKFVGNLFQGMNLYQFSNYFTLIIKILFLYIISPYFSFSFYYFFIFILVNKYSIAPSLSDFFKTVKEHIASFIRLIQNIEKLRGPISFFEAWRICFEGPTESKSGELKRFLELTLSIYKQDRNDCVVFYKNFSTFFFDIIFKDGFVLFIIYLLTSSAYFEKAFNLENNTISPFKFSFNSSLTIIKNSWHFILAAFIVSIFFHHAIHTSKSKNKYLQLILLIIFLGINSYFKFISITHCLYIIILIFFFYNFGASRLPQEILINIISIFFLHNIITSSKYILKEMNKEPLDKEIKEPSDKEINLDKEIKEPLDKEIKEPLDKKSKSL